MLYEVRVPRSATSGLLVKRNDLWGRYLRIVIVSIEGLLEEFLRRVIVSIRLFWMQEILSIPFLTV